MHFKTEIKCMYLMIILLVYCLLLYIFPKDYLNQLQLLFLNNYHACNTIKTKTIFSAHWFTKSHSIFLVINITHLNKHLKKLLLLSQAAFCDGKVTHTWSGQGQFRVWIRAVLCSVEKCYTWPFHLLCGFDGGMSHFFTS